jgi:hypothetical protein
MISTERIGNFPRPLFCIDPLALRGSAPPDLPPRYATSSWDTIERVAARGSPLIREDTATACDTTFAEITARAQGTALAAAALQARG